MEFLAAYGITTGTGDGATFSPASTLTRGDYILMLYRTFGFSSTAAAGNFTDVAAGSYYAEALAHAKALGIATAEADGSFRPNDPRHPAGRHGVPPAGHAGRQPVCAQRL